MLDLFVVNDLLVLDSRTDRIKRNLGNQSVGDYIRNYFRNGTRIMLFQLKKLPEIINLTRFLKSFWILYIDQIILCNALTFYIIKDRCQMHALNVFRSPVWLLLHKLSSPHYRYIRKMRRGDRLPLTQMIYLKNCSLCFKQK